MANYYAPGNQYNNTPCPPRNGYPSHNPGMNAPYYMPDPSTSFYNGNMQQQHYPSQYNHSNTQSQADMKIIASEISSIKNDISIMKVELNNNLHNLEARTNANISRELRQINNKISYGETPKTEKSPGLFLSILIVFFNLIKGLFYAILFITIVAIVIEIIAKLSSTQQNVS